MKLRMALWFIEHKTKSKWDNVERLSMYYLAKVSSVTFYCSAKVSNLGKFWGKKYRSNLTQNSGNCSFFSLYKYHNKKFVYSIWQTTTFHYSAKVFRLSTIRWKSKTLSYLDFVLCSMNRPMVKHSYIGAYECIYVRQMSYEYRSQKQRDLPGHRSLWTRRMIYRIKKGHFPWRPRQETR
jgi:hypothetical protein